MREISFLFISKTSFFFFSVITRWQKKHKSVGLLLFFSFFFFYYVAQLAPDARGLCSFSSVPESRTAARESPLCGDESSL